MKKKLCLSIAVALSLLLLPAYASAQGESVVGEPAADEEKATEEELTFAEAIEACQPIEGLFTLYVNEEEAKVLVEIKPEQLDRIFLCSVFREAGDGYYYDSGAMLDNFPFYLHRVGKRVQFVRKNVAYRAKRGAPVARAVGRGISDSVLASAAIESKPHPERKSFLVDASPLFLRDHANVGYRLSQAIDGCVSFEPEESYFGALKSFPLNTEIEAVVNFRSDTPLPAGPAIPDRRNLRHIYRFSLSILPEDDYRPRLADDRVGHFITRFQDYTDLTRETPYVRYVERWRLEKKYPDLELSPPRKPIVFWLENTVPVEYRNALKEGILEWNKAFEKIGFKNAIVVKQQPDDADWDAGDIRYNAVQWIVMPGSGYAVGPSHVNPYTGEIYSADIRITADFVRYYAMTLEELVDPLEGEEGIDLDSLDPAISHRACSYAEGKMREAAFGWSLLTARGDLSPDSRDLKGFIENGLKDLVIHEVGHTLGLRHNFKASTIHTLDEVHNMELTEREGISGSVMDYNTVNLAAKEEKQGHYWQTMLGTYDYWAIQYAYEPIDAKTPEEELPELRKTASKVSDPKLTYGTDYDARGFSPQSIDPLTNMWDLGSDPIAFYKHRIALANELIHSMERGFAEKGSRYQKLRRVFGRAMGQYRLAALTIPKFIGGIYYHTDHIGDPGGRVPFEPVSAARQREAMRFLREHIFGYDAFRFPPSLLNKLAPERFPDFEDSIYEMERMDYPVHEVVLNIQRSALDRMYHPTALNRMLDLPLHYQHGEEPFTLAEMFQQLRFAIWEEIYDKENVNSFRRNLQRAHLSKLASLVLDPGPAPEDASTLARADLLSLSRAITEALRSGNVDAVTRAHLEESLARITATLKAGVDRTM